MLNWEKTANGNLKAEKNGVRYAISRSKNFTLYINGVKTLTAGMGLCLARAGVHADGMSK